MLVQQQQQSNQNELELERHSTQSQLHSSAPQVTSTSHPTLHARHYFTDTVNNNDEPLNINSSLKASQPQELQEDNPPDPYISPNVDTGTLLNQFEPPSSLDNNCTSTSGGSVNSAGCDTPSPTPLVHSHSVIQFNSPTSKMSDAYLSSVRDMVPMQKGPRVPISAPNTPESLRRAHTHLTRDKKEKMEYNQMMMRSLESRPLSYHGRSGSICLEHPNSVVTVNKRHIMSTGSRSRKESLLLNRRSMPTPFIGENRLRDKIDISDLDTNLPRIDLEAIETHLRQAREEERKRRSDREEIRRRLALALEADGGEPVDKPRKHNLHSRLQSSMNLQICFMNETASDSESPNSDTESHKTNHQPHSLPCLNKVQKPVERKAEGPSSSTEDFFARQARLQAEARQALAQAKEMARLQLSQEREGRAQSPITEMVRNSLEKVGVGLPPDRRRVSRQLLTEMNVAQLQVIVNDLHSHIEKLNETLVSMLLERDDLHMEQDSMLVDIEDLTRYLAAKYNSPHQSLPLISASQSILGKK